MSVSVGLKFPPAPRVRSGEVADGIVGTLLRLLACFRPDASYPQPLRDVLSSPSMLLLALRNLENRRRRTEITANDVVLEACDVATSLLEFVYQRSVQRAGEIPPDAVLMRCRLQPSRLSLWPVVERLRQYPLPEADIRFVVRALQELESKRTPYRSYFHARRQLRPRGIRDSDAHTGFRRSVAPGLECEVERALEFAVGSVHRREWRSLQAASYSDSSGCRIYTPPLRPFKTRLSSSWRPPDPAFSEKQEALFKRLYRWQFVDVFAQVQRKFNQRVFRYKSPDTVTVVDKPAPTLTYPERRLTHELRRMVPTIHAQRYRGMQFRETIAKDATVAIYWYDSNYSDILASLSELETRLLKRGITLAASELEEPEPREKRRLRDECIEPTM